MKINHLPGVFSNWKKRRLGLNIQNMRNIHNFCPIVVHSATQISNSDWQDEDQGICNRQMMCLYMQKGFSEERNIFLCHLRRKGMKSVLHGYVTGLLGVFKDFCHTELHTAYVAPVL